MVCSPQKGCGYYEAYRAQKAGGAAAYRSYHRGAGVRGYFLLVSAGADVVEEPHPVSNPTTIVAARRAAVTFLRTLFIMSPPFSIYLMIQLYT